MFGEEASKRRGADIVNFFFHLKRAQEYANNNNWHSATDELEQALKISRRIEGKTDPET
jgi:Tfp pilus assembly protein PilF